MKLLRALGPGLVFLLLFSLNLLARGAGAVHVGGYTTRSGTYVAPHYRSAPDSSKANNWSTKGNANPYTGKAGTKKIGTSGAISAGGVGSETINSNPSGMAPPMGNEVLDPTLPLLAQPEAIPFNKEEFD